MTLGFCAEGLTGRAIVRDRSVGVAHIRSRALRSGAPVGALSNGGPRDGRALGVASLKGRSFSGRSLFGTGTTVASAPEPMSQGAYITLLLRSQDAVHWST